jgi:uncharacterized phage protein gp47/JayE
MPDLPSFPDLFRTARDEILADNSRLSRDVVERPGTDANILIAAACAAGDQIVGQLAQFEASIFLGSAKGDALDRLVYDRYGLVRKPAAAALTSVQFRTTAPSPTTFSIPLGTILQTQDGIQFITTEASIFTVGSTGPLTLAVRSILAGTDQSAKIGAITSIISALPSSPSDLVVTNPLATVGADDAESDDALRDRARRYFETTRRGTNAAIEAAALTVSGVRSASVFEVVDSLGRPARFVQLIIADAFTEQFAILDTVPAKYQQQSQQLSALVFTSLADVRPAGTFVQVLVGSVILQAVQLALAFTAGADVNTSALAARGTAVNYVNALAPGKPFVRTDLQAALKLVPGLSYTGNEVISPLGDVVAKPLQILRTSLGIVSAMSAQTNQPIITGTNPDAYLLAAP